HFPSLSADGTKLVFTGEKLDLMSHGAGSFGLQVYVKDLVTGALSFVTPDPSANSPWGAISPDGDQVVFLSNEQLDPTGEPAGLTHNEETYYTYVTNLADGIPHIRVFDSAVPDAYNSYPAPSAQIPVYPLSISSNGHATRMVFTAEDVGDP